MVGAAASAFGIVIGIVVACFVLAWPVYKIVEAWFERRIDTGELVVALLVMLGFLMGIMATWGRPANIALWLLLIGLALVVVFGSRRVEKHTLDRFFEEDVAGAKRAIVAHPDNAAAYMRLGQLYEQRGDLETAITHYEEVVRLVPRDSEGRLALANAVEKRRLALTGDVLCWQCGRENAPDAAFCQKCGALISERNRLLMWLSSRKATVILGWSAGILLVIAVVTGVSHLVPMAATVLLYLAILALSVLYVLPRWARTHR
jgi:tetratricopeptide (TPR) repeat protein